MVINNKSNKNGQDFKDNFSKTVLHRTDSENIPSVSRQRAYADAKSLVHACSSASSDGGGRIGERTEKSYRSEMCALGTKQKWIDWCMLNNLRNMF